MPLISYTEEEMIEGQNKAEAAGIREAARRIRLLEIPAIAPEHRIWFKAGWREAIMRALAELS